MYAPCPSCNSGRVVTKNIGKQAGGLIGVAGGIAGATLGEQMDDKVLNNFQCLECGYSFSVNR